MKQLILVTIAFAFIGCASNKKEEKSAAIKKAEVYYGQGTRQLVDKNYTSALKHLLQANALDPNNTKTENNLAMAYHFKGRTDFAIKYLEKSIKSDTKITDARLNLATFYMSKNQYKEAELQYNHILDDLT